MKILNIILFDLLFPILYIFSIKIYKREKLQVESFFERREKRRKSLCYSKNHQKEVEHDRRKNKIVGIVFFKI